MRSVLLRSALGWSPGFLPDVQVSPYLKLLPMLAGIGSPGTVQARPPAPFSCSGRTGHGDLGWAHLRGCPLCSHPRPQEVLRGYVGDQSAKPVFDSPTPFDILGTG